MALSFSFKRERTRPGQEVQFSLESSPLSWRMEVEDWAGGVTSHVEWEPRAEAEMPALGLDSDLFRLSAHILLGRGLSFGKELRAEGTIRTKTPQQPLDRCMLFYNCCQRRPANERRPQRDDPVKGCSLGYKWEKEAPSGIS